MTTTHPVVLLTNDDGFGSAGLNAMHAALVQAGARVVTIAPETNQSARSHHVTVSGRLKLAPIGPQAFTCSGSPADCVRVAVLSGVVQPPQLVVSGINHGANAGEDVHYSGTVAAAAEAALLGVPAVAVSQDGDGPELPFLTQAPAGFPDAGYAAEVALWMARHDPPANTFLSLTLPSVPMRAPAELATVGRRAWWAAEMRCESGDGGVLVDPWAEQPTAIVERGTDYAFLREGLATISLLSVRGGLHDALEKHPTWAGTIPRTP